jgi:histone H1/5
MTRKHQFPSTVSKKKIAAKPQKPAAHPKYSGMVGKAIAALKERGGSSRQAILKYIMADVYCSTNDLIITLAWTISVYDADADLFEDTYKNI